MDTILVYVAQIDEEKQIVKPHIAAIPKEDHLEDMYRLLNCSLVDARTIFLDKQRFVIWFDDEFLLKNAPLYPTFWLYDYEQPLCGNYMITKEGEDGETVGLTKEEALFVHKWILKHQHDMADKTISFIKSCRHEQTA